MHLNVFKYILKQEIRCYNEKWVRDMYILTFLQNQWDQIDTLGSLSFYSYLHIYGALVISYIFSLLFKRSHKYSIWLLLLCFYTIASFSPEVFAENDKVVARIMILIILRINNVLFNKWTPLETRYFCSSLNKQIPTLPSTRSQKSISLSQLLEITASMIRRSG